MNMGNGSCGCWVRVTSLKFQHANDGTNNIVRQATPFLFYGSAVQLPIFIWHLYEKGCIVFNDGGWGRPAMVICLRRLFRPASGFSLNHHLGLL